MPIFETTPLIKTLDTAQDLDAKRMANKTTKSLLDHFAGDPTTQFIAMHPDSAVAIINAMKVPLYKKRVNDRIAAQAQGVANPDDPIQKGIVDSVMSQQEKTGNNPDTNLPVNPVNDPTMEGDNSKASNFVDDNTMDTPSSPAGQNQSISDFVEDKPNESSPIAIRRKLLSNLNDANSDASKKNMKYTSEASSVSGDEQLGLPVAATSASLDKLADASKDNADRFSRNVELTLKNDPSQVKLTNGIEGDKAILTDARQSAINAKNTISNLQEASNIVSKNGISAGTLNPIKEKLGGFVSSLGIKEEDLPSLLKTAGDLNGINKITKTAVLGAANSAFNGQRISNLDLSTINQTIPDINANTTEGFQKITKLISAIQQRNIDYSKLAQKWADTHGSTNQVNSKGEHLDEVWDKYVESHPLSKTLKTSEITKNNSNSSFKEGQTATNPETGHKITFKNGKWE